MLHIGHFKTSSGFIIAYFILETFFLVKRKLDMSFWHTSINIIFSFKIHKRSEELMKNYREKKSLLSLEHERYVQNRPHCKQIQQAVQFQLCEEYWVIADFILIAWFRVNIKMSKQRWWQIQKYGFSLLSQNNFHLNLVGRR